MREPESHKWEIAGGATGSSPPAIMPTLRGNRFTAKPRPADADHLNDFGVFAAAGACSGAKPGGSDDGTALEDAAFEPSVKPVFGQATTTAMVYGSSFLTPGDKSSSADSQKGEGRTQDRDVGQSSPAASAFLDPWPTAACFWREKPSQSAGTRILSAHRISGGSRRRGLQRAGRSGWRYPPWRESPGERQPAIGTQVPIVTRLIHNPID